MLSALPCWLKGSIATVLLCTNTAALVPLLLAIALARLVIPYAPWQRYCTRQAIRVAELWMTINSGWMRLTQKVRWDVSGIDDLDQQHWYLITANHQSWADILILQHLLNRKIPMMKFFLKQKLIWVPVIGLGWWALDFPFMKRYSSAYLAKHPEKRGKDLESTRRACEKFKQAPVTIFNFVEGTRFTPKKQQQQASPYRFLLKPKAGGMAFVLGAMGSSIHQLIDITIAYPEQEAATDPEQETPTFWQFLSGQVTAVRVRVVQREIPQEFTDSNYAEDEVFRQAFQQWINALWQEKDQLLAQLNDVDRPAS
jgi:1-acyl-sn-glycerol-3-phosphate acyltransferase